MTLQTAGLERNVRLYPWYAASFNAFFWMPVFFLYFSEQFPLETVLLLEAIYYAAVVIFEVPSGYFSDAIGRRPTLLISASAIVAACALFFFGSGFLLFAFAQVCLAVGIAFNSGTDTSFHYDSLAALGKEHEYGDREARAARNAFIAAAIAALLGGGAAVLQLRFAYGLSLVAGLVTLGIVAACIEPTARERAARLGVVGQLRACAGFLGRPVLRWLFGFAVLMTVLNHVPYEFYQPYFGLVMGDLRMPGEGAPLVAGLHMAAAMLLGSWFAAKSIRLRDRIGVGPVLLAAAVLQTVIIVVMGFVLHAVVVALILLRTAPRALMSAPLNAAIAPQIPQAQRATYLSMQSLAGRLSFSVVLVALSYVAGPGAAADWPVISLMLRFSAALAVVGLLWLALTMRPSLSSLRTPRIGG
ncbi:MAG: hypothetical protein IIC73_00890 [Armatimonadetes bacterium]|nr:hypothetical protein [Armatimonadota bacterium]